MSCPKDLGSWLTGHTPPTCWTYGEWANVGSTTWGEFSNPISLPTPAVSRHIPVPGLTEYRWRLSSDGETAYRDQRNYEQFQTRTVTFNQGSGRNGRWVTGAWTDVADPDSRLGWVLIETQAKPVRFTEKRYQTLADQTQWVQISGAGQPCLEAEQSREVYKNAYYRKLDQWSEPNWVYTGDAATPSQIDPAWRYGTWTRTGSTRSCEVALMRTTLAAGRHTRPFGDGILTFIVSEATGATITEPSEGASRQLSIIAASGQTLRIELAADGALTTTLRGADSDASEGILAITAASVEWVANFDMGSATGSAASCDEAACLGRRSISTYCAAPSSRAAAIWPLASEVS